MLPTKGMNGSCQACVACCLVMDDQLQLPMLVLSMRYHTCNMVGARGTLQSDVPRSNILGAERVALAERQRMVLGDIESQCRVGVVRARCSGADLPPR